MSAKPFLEGSYTLISPTTISVAGSKSTTIGSTTELFGAGDLIVYVATLPGSVTATIKVNNVSISLVPGYNHIPFPAGVSIGPITLTNSSTTVASVSLWAFVMGVS